MASYLKPEDYLEPACPLCADGLSGQTPVHRISLCRMMQKLDEYLARNDYPGAERHLRFWLGEARCNNDEQGALAVYNELMGLHRKCGQEAQALDDTRQALKLLDELELEGTVTAATTRVNVGTVLKAFGQPESALLHYRAAESVYLQALSADDARLGGLFNNMALALAEKKEFSQANAYYRRALAVMQQVENGALEQAITWLNMANCAEDELGILESEECVSTCLAYAEALLERPELPRNGYYAFVAEKCASAFRYFGHFAYAAELEQRAEEIYERA